MGNQSTTILILSDNQDFAESLAVLAAREFSAICKILKSESELAELQGSAESKGNIWNLLVSDRLVAGDFPFPVMVLRLPVRLRSLFAEIGAALAHSKNSAKNADIIAIGGEFQLSLRHRILRKNQNALSVDLTDKEIQILQAINGAGKVGITREELLKNVWGMVAEAELDTHALETHIYRLRKKIRDAFGVEIIKAIEGGYRV